MPRAGGYERGPYPERGGYPERGYDRAGYPPEYERGGYDRGYPPPSGYGCDARACLLQLHWVKHRCRTAGYANTPPYEAVSCITPHPWVHPHPRRLLLNPGSWHSCAFSPPGGRQQCFSPACTPVGAFTAALLL